jgi:hypothetical protein
MRITRVDRLDPSLKINESLQCAWAWQRVVRKHNLGSARPIFSIKSSIAAANDKDGLRQWYGAGALCETTELTMLMSRGIFEENTWREGPYGPNDNGYEDGDLILGLTSPALLDHHLSVNALPQCGLRDTGLNSRKGDFGR